MNVRRQQGLSLVELMIGLVLSSVIVLGIMQVFLSNRQAFSLTESLVRVQENGRFAINFIGTNIRQSGSFGCVPEASSQTNNIQSHTNFIATGNFNAIQLANGGGLTLGSTDGADGGADAFDAPDTLALLSLEESDAVVSAVDIALSTMTIAGGADLDYSAGNVFLVSNCQIGDYIQAGAGTSNVTVVPANAPFIATRMVNYDVANIVSTVSRVSHRHFSVNADNELMFDENANWDGQAPQALLEGIENIQFEYGVDVDGDLVPDYFDDITAVNGADEVENIVAVNISVLAVTSADLSQDVTTTPQTVRFNNKNLQMADTRLRKVFTSTVTLRNRLN